ncbi:MAG: signal recognition particle-docking protein FtsY [Firmicutes bacterium]|nr:signal recognition particle-docking protein FtsY [Bacillota bacterium]
MNLLQRFKTGLTKSRQEFTRRLGQLFTPGEITPEFFEQLEEALILGDVGAVTASELVEALQDRARQERLKEKEAVKGLLVSQITELLETPVLNLETEPLVILLVGVNGSGKTTTAAKLAWIYRQQEKKVLLVAGDTFRAAAIDQLQIWAERAGADIIKQQPGSDPAAVFFDALNAARARRAQVVIGDTAGRLHTRANLMQELEKIQRVVNRSLEGQPHLVWLVVDATTGQNGLAQARLFNQSVPVDGLVVTKLDGTARGGIVVAIQKALGIPVCYLGIGEGIDDLAPFRAGEFARALLE